MSSDHRARLTRRRFIEAGTAASLGALLARRAGAAPDHAASLPLITRAVPSSGERLPAVGLGTDAFHQDERDEIRAELARMDELGGSLIDTAASYGDSEALIGNLNGVAEPPTAMRRGRSCRSRSSAGSRCSSTCRSAAQRCSAKPPPVPCRHGPPTSTSRAGRSSS